MTNDIDLSLFKVPNETFSKHLELDYNYRILFSGRFGIGKTTFLKHYFKENTKQYNVIHLFPVNYSLLDNEDIFSYIKYDILVSLFDGGHEYPLKSDYYSFLKDWDSFMLDNIGQVIATTMLLIPKMGKQLNQYVKELKQLAADFDKYKRSKAKSEMNHIHSYLSQFHEAEGGIYEANLITLIIQEWLKDIKSLGKENVLIVDDLDRIDPHHIFRLLNVFSAHLDIRTKDESANKFGFDKVIFVGDIDNIKNIYQSQFGINTDFNGYVDKFYSLEVYRFDNRDNVLSIIGQLINNTKISGYLNGRVPVLHTNNESIQEVLFFLVSNLVSVNAINLRSIFNLYEKKIEIPKKSLKVGGVDFNPFQNVFLAAIYVLSLSTGDLNILKSKIYKLEYLPITDIEDPSTFIGNLIFLLDFIETRISPSKYTEFGSEKTFSFNITTKAQNSYSGQYNLYVSRHSSHAHVTVLTSLSINGRVTSLTPGMPTDVADLLKEVVARIDY